MSAVWDVEFIAFPTNLHSLLPAASRPTLRRENSPKALLSGT